MTRDNSLSFSTLVFAALTLLGMLALLTGCGSGGDTSLASGDEPDPAVVEIPAAYIKRPAPAPDQNGLFNYNAIFDLDDPIALSPGARLFIIARSSNLAEEVELTGRIRNTIAAELGIDGSRLSIDIRGLETSFDGQQMVFSVRAIPDIDDNDEPELHTWNLWIYDFETDALSYLIRSRLIRNEGAETGSAQDMDPHFLTDDHIVFSSSRNTALQESLLNEGRGQLFSPVAEDNDDSQAIGLHILDPDTQEITQISLSRTADMDASTLDSGEIIFSRRSVTDSIYSLYRINPSGVHDSSLYGANSAQLLAGEETAIGTAGNIHILQPRELPDGRIMALLMPDNASSLGGDIALINANGFIDLFTPANSYSGGSRGQTALTDLEVNALDPLSPGGKFLAAYPLRDGTRRVLVSWSSCRIQNGEGLIKPCSIARNADRINGELRPAPPQFGLWMYDPREQTQRPVVLAENGYVISEVVVAEPRTYPRTPADGEYDADLAALNQGLIIIDSVYNQDEGVVSYAPLGIAAYAEPGTTSYTNRPARFMRVLQPIPEPNEDVLDDIPASGGFYGWLEILGYVPVEPDGSVTVRVPANTPVMLNALDAQGRRILQTRRHTHWLNVAPGEVLRCVGCHDPNSNIPHGRLDSQPPSQNPGAVLVGGVARFPGADPALFADELGQTMAEVYDLRRPELNETDRVRNLQLQLTYEDEWTDTSTLTPDASLDLTYDSLWNLDPAFPLIVPNLDPALPGRIVIHYGDHIQPIWERTRTIELSGSPVIGLDGTVATSCISCHTTLGGTRVPAGQLDLTASAPTGNNAIFTRSYEDLTRLDVEYWQTGADAIGPRLRVCYVLDDDGNVVLDDGGNPIVDNTLDQTLPVNPPVRRTGARNSPEFFNCFENPNPDLCGRRDPPEAPPAHCTEDGGTVVDDTPVTTKPIPATFVEAQTLMATKTPPADLTVAPELMGLLRMHCQGCHSVMPTDPDAGTAPSRPHSDPDDDTAYDSLRNYISLVNPAASILVTQLQNNHNCWSADCNSDAAEMQTAITSFADAVEPVDVIITLPGGSPAMESSFDHYGLLTPSELRLLSEWLDIGAPFYNNPFDPRLSD